MPLPTELHSVASSPPPPPHGLGTASKRNDYSCRMHERKPEMLVLYGSPGPGPGFLTKAPNPAQAAVVDEIFRLMM